MIVKLKQADTGKTEEQEEKEKEAAEQKFI